MVSLRYEIDNESPEEKKRFIRAMFSSIVPAYDRLNRILSMGIDIAWRRSAVRALGDISGKTLLDLCCGTGDLSKALSRKGARVVSLDFCPAMIEKGIARGAIRGDAVVADASCLPFKDNAFDMLTIAFGIRNIPDLDNFIRETARVLKEDGTLLILELTRPQRRLMARLHHLYLKRVLPVVGWMVSGRLTAYRYLSKTVQTFIDPEMLEARFAAHGYACAHTHHSMGIATIVECVRSGRDGAGRGETRRTRTDESASATYSTVQPNRAPL